LSIKLAAQLSEV